MNGSNPNAPQVYGHSRSPLLPGNQPPAPAAPSPAELRQQLGQALSEAQDVLFKATTVFPFTLFPDAVVVDRTKVTISHRAFWQVSEVISIRIEDILNVTANVGPFFGSLKIATRFYNEQTPPYTVDFLWRGDALKAKRIMQGYVIATQKQIDCSSLDTKQLSTLLDELGKGAPEEG
jgi:hypothetical protein